MEKNNSSFKRNNGKTNNKANNKMNNNSNNNSNSNRNSNSNSNRNSNSNKNNKNSTDSDNYNILFYLIIAVVLLFLYSNYVMNDNVLSEESVLEEESLNKNRENFLDMEKEKHNKVLYLINRRKCFNQNQKKSFEEQDIKLEELNSQIKKLKKDLLLSNQI